MKIAALIMRALLGGVAGVILLLQWPVDSLWMKGLFYKNYAAAWCASLVCIIFGIIFITSAISCIQKNYLEEDDIEQTKRENYELAYQNKKVFEVNQALEKEIEELKRQIPQNKS